MSEKQRSPELKRYFAEAESWAVDREGSLRASRRIAWIVAVAAGVIALCEALALIFLMPLKTVEPYTLLVDRQTGFVQALKPLDAQWVTRTNALTQSFLVQYVIAREGYDSDALQSDYRKVALWSAGTARNEYLSGMQVSDPDSPIVRYPRSTIVDVRVKSVTPLSQTTAMVRFDTRRKDASGAAGPLRSWVSYVRFSYSDAPMSVEDRMVNPLGFQVSRYRRSVEALPPPEPAPLGIAPLVRTPLPATSPIPAVRAPASAPPYVAPSYPQRRTRSAPPVQL